MGKRQKLKQAKKGEKPNALSNWRKAAMVLSLSAGVIGAGITGYKAITSNPTKHQTANESNVSTQLSSSNHPDSIPTAITLEETRFARQAMPVLTFTNALQRKGQLSHKTVTFDNQNTAAMYDPESRTLLHVANERDFPDAFLNSFHERTHAIQFHFLPPMSVREFMYQKGMLTRGEYGKIELTLSDEQLLAYLKRFIPQEQRYKFLSKKGEPLKTPITSHWQSLFQKEFENRRQATAIFELHTNLFDTMSVHDDELFYASFKTDYKQFAHDLTREQFNEIKRLINGLYHVYSKTPDVHVKIAEYLGRNATNYVEFIQKAKHLLEKQRVTSDQIQAADRTRRELVNEAMQAGNIPKPKINFIIKRAK